MPDAAPETEPRWQDLRDAASPLVEVLQLDAIRTIRVEAELLDSDVADNLALEETVSNATAQVDRPSPNTLIFRINHEDVFTDADGTDGARVAVDIAVGFDIPADFETTSEQIEGVAATLVARIVHPYYREAVSSMLARLGIQGVTVGLIKFPPSRRASDEDATEEAVAR